MLDYMYFHKKKLREVINQAARILTRNFPSENNEKLSGTAKAALKLGHTKLRVFA